MLRFYSQNSCTQVYYQANSGMLVFELCPIVNRQINFNSKIQFRLPAQQCVSMNLELKNIIKMITTNTIPNERNGYIYNIDTRLNADTKACIKLTNLSNGGFEFSIMANNTKIGTLCCPTNDITMILTLKEIVEMWKQAFIYYDFYFFPKRSNSNVTDNEPMNDENHTNTNYNNCNNNGYAQSNVSNGSNQVNNQRPVVNNQSQQRPVVNNQQSNYRQNNQQSNYNRGGNNESNTNQQYRNTPQQYRNNQQPQQNTVGYNRYNNRGNNHYNEELYEESCHVDNHQPTSHNQTVSNNNPSQMNQSPRDVNTTQQRSLQKNDNDNYNNMMEPYNEQEQYQQPKNVNGNVDMFNNSGNTSRMERANNNSVVQPQVNMENNFLDQLNEVLSDE